jgi:hypothetical protein
MALSDERVYQLLQLHALVAEMTDTLAAMRRGARLNLKSWEYSSNGLPTVAHGLVSLLTQTERLYSLLCNMPDVDGELHLEDQSRRRWPQTRYSERLKLYGEAYNSAAPEGVLCSRASGCQSRKHCAALRECLSD